MVSQSGARPEVWRQEGFFPILPWSPLHGWEAPYVDHEHGLQSIAACGFTVAGFVQIRDLVECARLGLKAIVAPPKRPRYMGDEYRALVETGQLDEYVRDWVAEVSAAPGAECVIGYFLVDEPGASTFRLLGQVVAAFKRHAPDKLAYLNLYPNYATIQTYDESGQAQKSQLQTATYAEHLERYAAEVRPQFLSYDNYMVVYSDDLREPVKAALYYDNLLEARRASLEHGFPWWQVVCSNQIRAHTTIPTPASLALQAYTTLAAGGTGVGWFTYYGLAYGHAPIDGKTERKNPIWYALRSVNEQLRAIGPLMTSMRSVGLHVQWPEGNLPTGQLPPLPGRYVERIDARHGAAPVMVGEFEDASGTPHVMLVNLSLERSAKLAVESRDGRRVASVASVDDGRFYELAEDAPLWLAPGHGVLLRLS
jgi:hypothetical protein